MMIRSDSTKSEHRQIPDIESEPAFLSHLVLLCVY